MIFTDTNQDVCTVRGENSLDQCGLQHVHLTARELAAIGSLTPMQRLVFDRLHDGLSNKEIAALFGIHETTVKAHVSAVFKKLNCNNRVKVALLALKFAVREEAAGQVARCG